MNNGLRKWEVYLSDGRTIEVIAEKVVDNGASIGFFGNGTQYVPPIAMFAWIFLAGYKLIGDAE